MGWGGVGVHLQYSNNQSELGNHNDKKKIKKLKKKKQTMFFRLKNN